MDEFQSLDIPVSQAARQLIGCILERSTAGGIMRVMIVETEAYDQSDAASHSYNGQSLRNEVMFRSAGYLYVYFTYGMHYCCNVVAGKSGHGAAVLIRGVEPLDGEKLMRQNRPTSGVSLSNGPAKLCQALSIDKSLNGHYLNEAPLKLIMQPAMLPTKIVSSERIGLSKSKDLRLRFYLKDNEYVSRT